MPETASRKALDEWTARLRNERASHDRVTSAASDHLVS